MDANMPKNWDAAAGRVWPLLVGAAAAKHPLTYTDLTKAADTTPRNVGLALGPIQAFCQRAELPPLTGLVVNRITRKPGIGFIAGDRDDQNSWLKVVYDEDWSQIANPFDDFQGAVSQASLAKDILSGGDGPAKVLALVRHRGVRQQIFRRALLEAYNCACAFCGLTFTEALEAAHIVPYFSCEPAQEVDVQNGLLLCATHHRLFDSKAVTITVDNYIEYYDPKARDGTYSPADKAASSSLHGRRIALPVSPVHRPNPDLVLARRQLDGWPAGTAAK